MTMHEKKIIARIGLIACALLLSLLVCAPAERTERCRYCGRLLHYQSEVILVDTHGNCFCNEDCGERFWHIIEEI